MQFKKLKHKNGLLWLVFCLVVVVAIEHYGGDGGGSPQQTYQSGFLEMLDVEGHAIENHVAKTDDYLSKRLRNEDISAASTFNDYTEAEIAIRNVLLDRGSLVNKWLNAEKSNKKAFYTLFNKPIGRVLKRGWDAPRSGNQVRVVLIRDTDYDTGFFILTAYPEYR